MAFKQYSLNDALPFIQRIGTNVFDTFYSESEIRTRLKGKKYWIYFYQLAGERLGFVIWYPENKKSYCWLLAVDEVFHRKGIGKELLKFYESESKKQKFSSLLVKTNSKRKPIAILLKKLKYKEISREKNHWGDGRTAVFYEKKLA